MNKVSYVFSLIVLSSTLLFTADAQDRRNSRRGYRQPAAMSESTSKAWEKLQADLKVKDPAGYAEVQKLAGTNLPAAFSKMRELAVKAKLELPRENRSRRGPEGMGRPPFGENGMRGPGRDGMRDPGRDGMRGPGRGGMMPNQKRAEVEAQIAAKFPAEYAAYQKSAEANRVSLKTLAAKAGVKLPADFADMAAIRKKYEKELSGLYGREAMEKMRELVEKEGYEMGFPGMRMGKNGGAEGRPAPPPKRDFSRAMLARKAKEQYPEEWEAYIALRKTDKAAAEKKLDELLKKVK